MLAQLHKLLTVSASVAIAAVAMATPAQAFNVTFSFSFLDADEDASNDPKILGSFFANDVNSNARLDFDEITSFAAAFAAPDELAIWALTDLSTESFYISPDNYLLAASNAAGDFRSNSIYSLFDGGSAGASTEVFTGFTYFDSSALTFTPPVAVPEPITITGLALAGAGLAAARRRARRA